MMKVVNQECGPNDREDEKRRRRWRATRADDLSSYINVDRERW